jgi:hypothetical protein
VSAVANEELLAIIPRRGAPPADALKHCDLLWPRKPNDHIPYIVNVDVPNLEQSDRDAWNEVREEIASGAGAPDLSPDERAAIAAMSYQEFRAKYEVRSDERIDEFGLGLSVGHVAMVDLEADEPMVIEALWGDVGHVIRRTYKDWATDHSGDLCWLGEIKIGAPYPRRIIEIAREMVGKPYNFTDMNLDDDRGFYCSKLVWCCAWRAAQIAMDDNPDPHRGFWYSPKQLLHSPHVRLRVNPGSYGG